ncbi:GNAT family N-acetyltransferase [Rhizobium halophytocola]|uniref:CelD/BcsL family acetyltransferase involved in cellulose biosynthesis n=1 Tax=Rhizobium halophytocola TaxID=735519 RepID=A0ABS4DYA2_9HYPH|nr:GNAT family N-acetyltransferase [Rhizobium halophytocola]MBP1850663.1 CelD/BcsL family acetyltransferase involved in cellulose biosynthesis [Rhizobium halophytocola]
MTIRVVDRMELLEAEWRMLDRDSMNSLHQSYDWCAAWVKTHGNPLALLHGEQDGRTAFILPLEIVRHSVIRTAQFIGSRFSNINTGLFSAAMRADGQTGVGQQIAAEAVRLLSGKADLLHLENMPLGWRGERHPFAGLPAMENRNHTFQLPLLDSFEQTLSQVNARSRRKKYRNQVRRLEAMGGFRHLVARSEAEKQFLLDLFFIQKAERFKSAGLPNVFQAPSTQAFFRLLLEGGHDGTNTPLELHGIELRGAFEGQIAAIAGMSRKGDHAICQFGSIDPTLARDASPGELLFWLLIEQFCAEGATLFDFGLGDQGYKRSWCTIETVQHDVLLPISASGRLAAYTQRGLNHTKAVIKNNPQLYGFLQRLRAQSDAKPVRKAEPEN